MKKCGLYGRVSLEKQALVEEGSLKNQEQMLMQYVKIKATTSDEEWAIVDRYIERGKSGKDTNRPEYNRMMQDTKEGRINTVLCTALSRISRSTKDLLHMIDDFNQQNIDFICLKEQFDTTTSQGKCVLTIMGALNQFEREQTSERVVSNMFARAERGLWNGGFILGYDLHKDRKGYLLPNQQEAKTVNFLFDTYLESGSVLDTARIANKQGYRTKEYASRRGNHHPPKEFCYSSVLSVLTNQAYIGVREINKRNKHKDQKSLTKEKKYAACEAVWEPIVDRKKFDKIQHLLKDNLKHKNNGAKPKKHSYLFNGGLLACHKCGSQMEGRNAHGRNGTVYYYYCCKNSDCRHRVQESEIEQAFQQIVRHIANTPSMLQKITDKLNDKLKGGLPLLRKQREGVIDQISGFKGKAARIIDKLADLENGRDLIDNRLKELDSQSKVLYERSRLLDTEIESLEKQSIDISSIKRLLKELNRVFDKGMKPYQKKALLNCILSYIRICDKEFKLGIDSQKFRSDIVKVLRYNVVRNVSAGYQH